MDKPAAMTLPIDADLAGIRQAVRRFAEEAGLAGERLQNLVLAVNEAVTNVLDHGAGTGSVHLSRAGQGVRVQIVDPAGRLRPADLDRSPPWPPTHGMGLWVIRQVCDEVRLDHPEGHSRLELYMACRPVTEPGGTTSAEDAPPREARPPVPRHVLRLRRHRDPPPPGDSPEDDPGRPRFQDAAGQP
ncbi:Serine-protein kinase RsbW [Nonomuraea coxensis DSM 45129]|uniref:Serine-protein kinase RsbW n=1 Tax=Nonomuraea coxensis DSM 45129 TaxID=1122611 RepID=A0ABX8TRT8_9ACTN|nr:ATP-binding protein [Nonomuraea coxensis]QYC38190.1 Serine-protein kinase RsbW [Nonomuraea coxensis DSM 45129]